MLTVISSRTLSLFLLLYGNHIYNWLGLSIAKEILDQNNCSIDIKSKAGEGTEVVIRIPTK